MLALVDISNQIITLYGSFGEKIFSFSQIREFEAAFSHIPMIYVTAAMESSGAEISNLVRSMIGESSQELSQELPPVEPSNQRYYLRSTLRGSCVVRRTRMVDGEEVEHPLFFSGPADAKLLDENLAQFVQTNPHVQALLKQGKMEIVNDSQLRQAVRDHQSYLDKRNKIQRLKDKKDLDSIIIENSDPGSAAMVASSGRPHPDDIFATEDITNDVLNGGTALEELNPDDLTPEQLSSLYGGRFT